MIKGKNLMLIKLQYKKTSWFWSKSIKTITHKKCGDWLVEKLKKFELQVTEQIGEVVAFNGENFLYIIIKEPNPNSIVEFYFVLGWDHLQIETHKENHQF